MKSILKKSGNRPLICIFSTLKKLFSVNRRTLLYKRCTLAQILPAVNVRLKDVHTEMSIRYYVIRSQSLVYWYKIQQAQQDMQQRVKQHWSDRQTDKVALSGSCINFKTLNIPLVLRDISKPRALIYID